MAITKIHPIKSTLNLAIDYITSDDKTDKQILISSDGCSPATAHLQFMNTRETNDTRGTVLARHLIQSFVPGEVSPDKAHEIGIALAKEVLNGEYEYVLATHVDRNHIHNHIIFNNVNWKTGKCYQSNKRSYHKIRYQSDKLCKENNLIVIDEYYEKYKKKYKTRGKSYREYQEDKKGASWKSKLQFDIDRAIKKAKDWEDFLHLMEQYGYEIKHGKITIKIEVLKTGLLNEIDRRDAEIGEINEYQPIFQVEYEKYYPNDKAQKQNGRWLLRHEIREDQYIKRKYRRERIKEFLDL